jgi:hypothetical protein
MFGYCLADPLTLTTEVRYCSEEAAEFCIQEDGIFQECKWRLVTVHAAFFLIFPLLMGYVTSATSFHILKNLNASITTQTSHFTQIKALNERKLLRIANDHGPYRYEHTVAMSSV